jgi:hypothetical protein
MGRRDFQSTVADTLPRLNEDLVKKGIGSIQFTKRDKKTIGKLYFRNGFIYAIELSTYLPNIVNRIATNEYIVENNRTQILEKYKNNLSDVSSVKYVLARQLLPEVVLITYIKDYFLDSFDELYQWTEVNVEWRSNDEPSVPTVPNIALDDIVEKLKKRREYLENVVAAQWNVSVEEIDSLRFKSLEDHEEDTDYMKRVLITVANGEWTIGGVAEYLGLSRFNAKLLVFELWKDKTVEVIDSTGKIVEPKVEKVPRITSTSSFPQIAVEAKQEEIEEQEEVDLEETLPNPLENSELVAEPDEIIIETNQELLTSEQKTSIETISEDMEQNNPTPVSTPKTTTSRISQIAQQFAQELTKLKSLIQSVEAHKRSIETNIKDLQVERKTLIESINALDDKVKNHRALLDSKTEELANLQNEYDESIQLTQNFGK